MLLSFFLRLPLALTATFYHQRDERVLVVWAYTFDDIIPTVRDFEEKLIHFIVEQRNMLGYGAFAAPSVLGSAMSLGTHKNGGKVIMEEVGDITDAVTANANKETEKVNKTRYRNANKKSRSCLASGFGYFVSSKDDVEKTAEGPSARPIRLLAPFNSGVAVALSICASLLPLPSPVWSVLCAGRRAHDLLSFTRCSPPTAHHRPCLARHSYRIHIQSSSAVASPS